MNEDRFEELDATQRRIAGELRETLRASENVDAVTAARLAQARARAISAAGANRPRLASPWLWAPGAALAAAALVAVLVLPVRPPGTSPAAHEPNDADALEMMTDELDSDFYEDLEMVRWLEQDGNV